MHFSNGTNIQLPLKSFTLRYLSMIYSSGYSCLSLDNGFAITLIVTLALTIRALRLNGSSVIEAK